MKHLKQDRTFNCGQTCVAILLGKTINFAEYQIGKKGRTTTAELKKVLSSEYSFPARLKLFKGNDVAPRFALMRVNHPISGKHWVVMEGGETGNWEDVTIYDPVHKKKFNWKQYGTIRIKYNLTMTSYLPLVRK